MLEKFDIPFGRRFQLPVFAISIVLSVFKVAYSPQSYNVYNYFPNKRRFFLSHKPSQPRSKVFREMFAKVIEKVDILREG
jgi:hypothetical protein